jgi:Heparinase II/III-like protein
MWKLGGLWLAMLTLAAGDLAEKPHPRLWFPKAAEAALREKLSRDPLAAELQARVMTEAREILKSRTCRYEIPDGKRLLAESRLALTNVLHSAWAWRMEGDEKFRLRAISELDAACALKDWNTSHFLDTAEMATAVGIGYDWLYSTLTPEQRTRYEKAIVEKSLLPAKAVYDKGSGWSKPRNNWSQVCGSGIALAAAAIAGNDAGLSEPLFEQGLRLVEKCAEFYAPDGMYPEGPSYWHYGTNYHVMLLAAARGLGQPFQDDPILKQAGNSIIQLTGPTRQAFNFADGGTGEEKPSAAQGWLASHFRDPAQTQAIRDLIARVLRDDKNPVFSPLMLLWLPEAPSSRSVSPLASAFRGEQAVATFRTGWDSQATFIAIKGGTPAASHGHMDVGSFVFDAHGLRWVHDLGKENYNLPGYFGNKRWSYYRLQNRSHNTLEIDGNLQNPQSKPCPLLSSTLTGNPLAASFDLSAAYSDSAGKVIRSVRFDPLSGRTILEDRITKPTGPVVWRVFTDAEPEVKGDQVTLRKNGSQITLKRLSDAGEWSTRDAKPPTAEENQNRGFRAVVLTIPKADEVSARVEIQP